MTIEAPTAQREPHSQRTAVRGDVMSRLKHETAAEHEAIEAVANLVRPDLSLAEYRRYLEKSYGFHLVIEAALWRFGVWGALGLSPLDRAKLRFLARDLALLDGSMPVPLCTTPPSLRGLEEAVGAAYVIEGSTLGGRVIARHVEQRFGPSVPRSFLECYGARSAEQWKSFRVALARFATTREIEERVVAGAKETFRAFTRWLELPDGARSGSVSPPPLERRARSERAGSA